MTIDEILLFVIKKRLIGDGDWSWLVVDMLQIYHHDIYLRYDKWLEIQKKEISMNYSASVYGVVHASEHLKQEKLISILKEYSKKSYPEVF